MDRVAEATIRDIPQLCDLLTLLFTQEAEFRPDSAKQVVGLRQIIEHPEVGRILVIREGSTTIGMVNLLYTISTALGGHVAILEDMIVRPDRRGGGVGTELLQGAIAYARDAGCSRITLLTDCTNIAAIRFYKRNSFVLSEMVALRLVF